MVRRFTSFTGIRKIDQILLVSLGDSMSVGIVRRTKMIEIRWYHIVAVCSIGYMLYDVFIVG